MADEKPSSFLIGRNYGLPSVGVAPTPGPVFGRVARGHCLTP